MDVFDTSRREQLSQKAHTASQYFSLKLLTGSLTQNQFRKVRHSEKSVQQFIEDMKLLSSRSFGNRNRVFVRFIPSDNFGAHMAEYVNKFLKLNWVAKADISFTEND
ncbi:UNVERIFIED_CONTAM: hypothetical protein B566_EDAN018140 [Ephemera danica]|nr:hypothetical protein B566_EDAN018140 [Ephemera danica]